MIPDHLRDAAATGAIFGLAASVWFGWALPHSPKSWRRWLVAGLIPAYATLVTGLILTVRNWNGGTVFDATTSPRFGIVVGVEVAIAGIGVGVLAARRRSDLVPIWIALVVGVHLFPVAVILRYPWIHVVGALTTGAALVAAPIARRRSLAVSTVNGACVGLALLTGAVVALVTALTW
ncbi:hypothetical protein ACN27F_05425 [Solwaraspora sp. WMMB335]|uniref:hypothetical protein n=1 Tax=Solwaraspora sp. WMMB335 TaxID=3404118 RepID=UPI003B949E90